MASCPAGISCGKLEFTLPLPVLPAPVAMLHSVNGPAVEAGPDSRLAVAGPIAETHPVGRIEDQSGARLQGPPGSPFKAARSAVMPPVRSVETVFGCCPVRDIGGSIRPTMASEGYLSAYIGNYRPSMAYLDDAQGKNAFATPRDITGQGSPHGAVLMGVHLMRDLLNRRGAKTEYSNAWSVAAVLAHEWAHIAQFARGVRTRDGRVVGMELMADAISGWYLAKKLQLVGQTLGPIQVQRIGAADQTAAARAVYSLGDTNFTSRNHHGTSEQRVRAFVAGHNMGMQGGTFEHVFRFGQSRFVRH